jgi:hypothetical protein
MFRFRVSESASGGLSTVDLRFTVRLEALSGGRLTLCLFSAEGGLQEVRCEQSTMAAVSHVIDDRLGLDDSASPPSGSPRPNPPRGG